MLQRPDLFALLGTQFEVNYVLDVFGGRRRQTEVLAAQAEVQRFPGRCRLPRPDHHERGEHRAADRQPQGATGGGRAKCRRRPAHAGDQSPECRRAVRPRRPTWRRRTAPSRRWPEQAVPDVQKQIGQLADQLAVYLGRTPDAAQTIGLDLSDIRLPADLPLSLPSELVRQRPDLRAAEEANLHAASAAVGVAMAARLPSFTLTGSFGGISSALGSLLSDGNGFWAIGGSAAHTLFDAGALRHQQEGRRGGAARPGPGAVSRRGADASVPEHRRRPAGDRL